MPKSMTVFSLSTLLVSLLFLSAFLLSNPNLANAATTDDKAYKFSMKTEGTSATDGRDKNNTTPIYVRIDRITKQCRMYVDGKKTGTKWTNCTVNGYAIAKKKGKWCIKSTVHESGYGYARLTAWADKGPSTVQGVWSPDSKGSYTAINAK